MYKTTLFLLAILFSIRVFSFLTVENRGDTLIAKTPLVERHFYHGEDQFYTTCLKNSHGYDYSREGSFEFSFTVNGIETNGTMGHFRLVNYSVNESGEGAILICRLQSLKFAGLEIVLAYEFTRDNPVIRKKIEFSNSSGSRIQISDLFVERIMADPWGGILADIYGYYASVKFQPPYTGWAHDPFIWVKGSRATFGVGNEAPGITKFTGIYDRQTNEIRVGMTPSDHPYAVAIGLETGERWESPATFLILTDWQNKEKYLTKFIASGIELQPVVNAHNRLFYNTWNPFRREISDTLIMQISRKLKDTGMDFLIMDDGWQDYFGDWNSDPVKFPNGLKPVCDSIRKQGLIPGLWLTPFTIDAESAAYNRFKDFVVKDQNGQPTNLHGWTGVSSIYTMDATSVWFDHILQKTSQIIGENGIGYVKLDFAVVKSAYVMDPHHSGNYDTTAVFSGQKESYLSGYEAMFRYCDSLRSRFPDLLIDITFELYGHNHIIDFALVKHAHLDWISNFEESPPYGPAKIRQLAYRISNAIPLSAMLIGNQRVDHPDAPLSFASNMAAIPVLLGNPLQLTASQTDAIAHLSQIYKEHCSSSDYIIPLVKSFEADDLSQWDGFLRISRTGGHGLVFLFRNESQDQMRSFSLNDYGLEPFESVRLLSGEGNDWLQQDQNVLKADISKQNGFLVGLIQRIQ